MGFSDQRSRRSILENQTVIAGLVERRRIAPVGNRVDATVVVIVSQQRAGGDGMCAS